MVQNEDDFQTIKVFCRIRPLGGNQSREDNDLPEFDSDLSVANEAPTNVVDEHGCLQYSEHAIIVPGLTGEAESKGRKDASLVAKLTYGSTKPRVDRNGDKTSPPGASSQHARVSGATSGGDGSFRAAAGTFAFDEVFSPTCTQSGVFEKVGKQMVRSVVQGYNGTILTYGQTASGKTHTMCGLHPSCFKANFPKTGAQNETLFAQQKIENSGSQSYGLIPRVAVYMFEYLQHLLSLQQTNVGEPGVETPTLKKTCVGVSVFEIYNEIARDLLTTKKDSGEQNHEGSGLQPSLSVNGIKAGDLSHHKVEDAAQLLGLVMLAQQRRAVAGTNMNSQSSRSHMLVCLSVKTISTRAHQGRSDSTDTVQTNGCLYLVDLAGSERLKKTQAEGHNLREGLMINKSLSCLGNVIKSLTSKDSDTGRYVPYRDSILTRVLQSSLSGQNRTCLIVNVSPCPSNLWETVSTLRFAQRAKYIKASPMVHRAVVNSSREITGENVVSATQEEKISPIDEHRSGEVNMLLSHDEVQRMIQDAVRSALQSQMPLLQGVVAQAAQKSVQNSSCEDSTEDDTAAEETITTEEFFVEEDSSSSDPPTEDSPLPFLSNRTEENPTDTSDAESAALDKSSQLSGIKAKSVFPSSLNDFLSEDKRVARISCSSSSSTTASDEIVVMPEGSSIAAELISPPPATPGDSIPKPMQEPASCADIVMRRLFPKGLRATRSSGRLLNSLIAFSHFLQEESCTAQSGDSQSELPPGFPSIGQKDSVANKFEKVLNNDDCESFQEFKPAESLLHMICSRPSVTVALQKIHKEDTSASNAQSLDEWIQGVHWSAVGRVVEHGERNKDERKLGLSLENLCAVISSILFWGYRLLLGNSIDPLRNWDALCRLINRLSDHQKYVTAQLCLLQELTDELIVAIATISGRLGNMLLRDELVTVEDLGGSPAMRDSNEDVTAKTFVEKSDAYIVTLCEKVHWNVENMQVVQGAEEVQSLGLLGRRVETPIQIINEGLQSAKNFYEAAVADIGSKCCQCAHLSVIGRDFLAYKADLEQLARGSHPSIPS